MSLIEPPVIPPKPEFDTRAWLKVLQRFLAKVDSEGVGYAATNYGLNLTRVELPMTPEFAADREFQAAVIELQNAHDQFEFTETLILDKYVRDFEDQVS